MLSSCPNSRSPDHAHFPPSPPVVPCPHAPPWNQYCGSDLANVVPALQGLIPFIIFDDTFDFSSVRGDGMGEQCVLGVGCGV